MLSPTQFPAEGLGEGSVCTHYADAAKEAGLTERISHSGLSRRRCVAARGLLLNCSYLVGLSLGGQHMHAGGMLSKSALIQLRTFLRCGSKTP